MIFTKIDNKIVQLTRGKKLYSGIPIGAIKISATKNLETYLPCEGQSLSKSEYPELYEVIGGTFGETSTTFNLPDLRGRIPEGADDNTLGNYSNEQIQSHNHTSSAHNHGITNHCHYVNSHCHWVCPHTHSRVVACFSCSFKTTYVSCVPTTSSCNLRYGVCVRSTCSFIVTTPGTTTPSNQCTTEGININTNNCNFDSASITVCSNTSTNSSTGDSETRGKRIGMYYMIKVKEND